MRDSIAQTAKKRGSKKNILVQPRQNMIENTGPRSVYRSLCDTFNFLRYFKRMFGLRHELRLQVGLSPPDANELSRTTFPQKVGRKTTLKSMHAALAEGASKHGEVICERAEKSVLTTLLNTYSSSVLSEASRFLASPMKNVAPTSVVASTTRIWCNRIWSVLKSQQNKT